MILTLSIRNKDALSGGTEPELRLVRQDALIGRSKTCDWSLTDDKNFISTRHCQISFRDDAYYLKDISTNGTVLNGGAQRMSEERRIENGDLFQIGQYQVVAALAQGEEATVFNPAAPAPAPAPSEGATIFAATSTSTWSRSADGGIVSAETPAPAAPAPEQRAAPAASPPPAEASARADIEPASVEEEEAPSEAFTRFISANDLDWARSGFGAEPTAPAPDLDGGDPVAVLLTSAGLQAGDSTLPSQDLMTRAGELIRRLVSGMVVMVEARARAKSQMGAESTSLQVDGNNPIKFARTPEQALKQLLNPKERGFMDAEKAVEDAFLDLQSHQVATLAAIPGSLKATLERFSPGSIKRRAEGMGILSRVIPAMRDATLWANYEREFAKVAQESDEAFMEVFAKEFRKYYDKQIQKQKQG